jgi:drug/metabolite transporter (DMT)-like permease
MGPNVGTNMAERAAIPARMLTSADWAGLVALSVLWSGSFFFVALAVKELPSLTVVALRVGFASFALLAAASLLGLRIPRGRKMWLAFLVAGALNNALPYGLIAWGQTHIASGLASILNATTPLATLIVAHLFTTDEKMTPRHLAGVLLGLAGVVVIIGPSLLGDIGTDIGAQFACLGAAVSYACGGVFSRRFGQMGLSSFMGATGQIVASAVLLIPLALIVDQPWTLPLPSASVRGAIIALAVVCTPLATILYFRILSTAGATNLLLVTFLVPVSAIALGALLLGERLMPEHLYGMACIGLGLAVIDGRILTLRHRVGRPQMKRAPGPMPRGARRRGRAAPRA